MPNIALIEHFQNAACDLVYVGSAAGIERDMIGARLVPYRVISTGKLRRIFRLAELHRPLSDYSGIPAKSNYLFSGTA